MIKQGLNQAACVLLREFCAEDSLGDCQTMSKIDDDRDEIFRLQPRSDSRRSQEVLDKLTSVTKLNQADLPLDEFLFERLEGKTLSSID